MKYDVVVIGGGPAGLAAAYESRRGGAEKVLLLERDRELGGILNQCIHPGFGLHYFQREMTGPEYAAEFIRLVQESGVEVKLETMVLTLTPDRRVHAVNPTDGYMEIEAGAVILCMGCRERTRGAIAIPGSRPAGVLTAGAAQRLMNMDGVMAGKRIVILGSGDIGLIMARRMTLEGAKVLACLEIMPYANGLNRNIVQCLHDFDIPLYLSHTVVRIEGKDRLEKIAVAKVGADRKPIPGTEFELPCDTLLLSVGLIPENELSVQAGVALQPRTNGPAVYENMETSVAGVFACGNVLHVHDIVDFVTEESRRAGRAAAAFALGARRTGEAIAVQAGENAAYTVPSFVRVPQEEDIEISFRVTSVIPKGMIEVYDGQTKLLTRARQHMAPGEMEHVVLPAASLRQASGPITVAVRKEGL